MTQEFDNQNYQACISAANTALTKFETKDTSYARVLDYLKYSYFFLADYQNACKYGQEELELRARIQGDDNDDYLGTVYIVGLFNTYVPNYPTAIPLLEESIAWLEAEYGKDSKSYVDALNMVAWMSDQENNVKKAEKYYDLLNQTLRETHELSDSIFQAFVPVFCGFYNANGLFEKSEPFFLETVAAWEEMVGREDHGFITALTSLGQFYIYAKWHQKAVETYETYLVDCEKVYGKKSIDYINGLYYLANSYEALKNFEKTAEHRESYLAIDAELFEERDSTHLFILESLAYNYELIGKHRQSCLKFEEYERLVRSFYGRASIEHLYSLWYLADEYYLDGKNGKAADLYDSVSSITNRLYQSTDSIFIFFTKRSVDFYESHALYEKAEAQLTIWTDLMKSKYGRKNDAFLTAENRLGEFYISAGWYDKAAKVFSEYINDCIEVYGKDSVDHATALNNLAVVFEKLGKNAEAEKLYLKSLEIKAKVYTKESDYYALSLSNLAVLYDNMGRYQEAEDLLERAVGIYKSVYGADSENYGVALTNLASVYASKGKFEKAINMAREALAIQVRIHGNEHYRSVNALNNLAFITSQKGDLQSADKLFTELLTLSETVLGKEHPDYATNMYNLANVRSNLGQYRQAEELLDEALGIQARTVGKTHRSYANTMSSLANLYFEIGDFQRADRMYNNCKPLFKKIHGAQHPEYATLMNNIGYYYRERGDFDRSEKSLLIALEIQHNTFGDNHPDNMAVLTNLSHVYLARNDLQMAQEYLVASHEIAKNYFGTNGPDYAVSLNNLATYYSKVGDYDKAEVLYQEALEKRKEIFGNEHKEYSTSLNNLATMYMSRAIDTKSPEQQESDANNAEKYFLEALVVDSVLGMLNHPDHGSHLNNLAELYRITFRDKEAEDLFLKCLAIEEENFGKDHVSSALTYHNLALLHAGSKNYELAEKYAVIAMEIKKKAYGLGNMSSENNLLSLAYIYEMSGQLDLSDDYYRQAMDSKNRLIERSFDYMSEIEKSKYLKSSAHFNNLFASHALNYSDQNAELAAMLYDIELKDKGALLRSSSKMKNAILDSEDASLIASYEDWIGVRQQLSKLYTMPLESRDVDVEDLELQANELEKTLVSGSADFRTRKTNPPDWKMVQKALDASEAAIEFTHFDFIKEDSVEEIYCALVLTKSMDKPELIKLFGTNDLEGIIGSSGGTTIDFVSKIYGNKNSSPTSLYDLVWGKIDPLLSETETVYISASGLLHKIAFSAILSNEKIFLSDRYEIHNLNSTSQIASLKSAESGSDIRNLCVFGGAIYQTEKSEMEVWSYLEGTKIEAEKISDLAEKSKVECSSFIGEFATEGNFKNQESQASAAIIHIATHGFFYSTVGETKMEEDTAFDDLAFRGSGIGLKTFVQNENPLMRTGLVFTAANDVWSQTDFSGEDGVLTAYEVSTMNLENTELVVMSACETGLGDIRGSEGVYGLQRAFKIAGVNQLIMSLWQVPDKETSEFMISFYEKLLSTRDIRKSFADTQAEMRSKYDPYYWGAFILVE